MRKAATHQSDRVNAKTHENYNMLLISHQINLFTSFMAVHDAPPHNV